ncbi:MAG: DUF2264 domain-containing protein [Lachnospiraceae bacterium]|nr:DUF2264 domain-containing protein [Lachnospiraceae bacterium]
MGEAEKRVYKKDHLDYRLSPYTGLTRESFFSAAKYLLGEIFTSIEGMDAPLVVKRTETEITYPHKNAGPARWDTERRAEIFEGLARSFFIAAPVIKEDPGFSVNGIVLRDYYKEHVLRTCRSGGAESAGCFKELKEKNGNDPFCPFQQTVETCALVICLDECREQIWETYTKEEKDTVASFISGYAHAATVPQNWRLFNMLDLAFLNMNGYKTDENVMLEHAQAILDYYVGNGWYRDGQNFDYYSCWAFNVYAPIWNKWYGYKNLPYIAKRFEENSNELMKTYPFYFGRNGFVNMWGRSCIYRNAAVSPMAANFFLEHPTVDPGIARKITAGALLQFFEREDFLENGVPSLGFYGRFSPLVQGYSCAESPLWLGKAFMCLSLPADHPFWTAKEEDGWDSLGKDGIKENVLDGPGLVYTNHAANGETILRTGKVLKHKNDFHGMQNYSKLCYNTEYPWEASPKVPEGKPRVEAMQYAFKDLTNKEVSFANATFYVGVKEGIFYRRQFFNFDTGAEMHWLNGFDLADFPVKYGIFRADKLRLIRKPLEITLGAYGFADNGAEIIRLEEKNAKAIIVKGRDKTGKDHTLAMTVYDGFSDISFVRSSGTNPDSEKSVVVYGKTVREHLYDASENYVLVSQVITRDDGQDFTNEDIFPLKEIEYTDKGKTGAYGPVKLIFKNGEIKQIDFEGNEGRFSL